MHFSRMRTARSLTVCHSVPCISGGGSTQPRLDAEPSPWMHTPLPNACWEANPPFPSACWEANPPAPCEQND